MHLLNRQGINVLHVAAQGEQPVSIAYFVSKGLELDSIDKKKSSSVHWAAYSGTDLTLNYLLSWGADIELRDERGMTPLHIAVRQHKENKSAKGIKQLLLKGADPEARDREGRRPIDHIPMPEDHYEPYYALTMEIREIL